MSVPRNILRVVLLTAAAGLLAVAASVLREKKATVDLTTQQIEDAISALDPGVRAAVIGRLTADAVQQVKDPYSGSSCLGIEVSVALWLTRCQVRRDTSAAAARPSEGRRPGSDGDEGHPRRGDACG